MGDKEGSLGRLGVETAVASSAYFATILLTFELVVPLQNLVFPEYSSRASLLFLPHGVRVLSAWLLGWRAVPALLPGVIAAFAYVGGMDVLLPSRMIAIAIAVCTVPLCLHLLRVIGLDLFPSQDRAPCWLCVMGVGIVTSLIIASLTNMAFGSDPIEAIAYLIGDISGLFFGMLALLYAFRLLGRSA
ncbi:hypothetical protein KBY24_20190 [Ruegeria pomeroyi]|uniref:Uncharacterized protein n=1 Tax=Ruegeria alba TaxID=2916756 RepID=A0ABS9P1M7_9RHOB|nr:hypothetical protein [Ruegeria alba]MCE8514212.1 hypothetical protein [Ruegeria pomeroyi]MCE8523524.1 hypothetical protein [Ruegeria pomeroyi]MCE8525471.1 hypothetical protein [Ruegeria pomeroyi]MCE8531649.1 hypothetical protein [Ruegeria pomeroyi]MCE8535709.1 hypothetical protein [Ruegeria pomeroyi]